MSLRLDRLQQRIIGVLIEKQYTVPDAYPMTVNGLVSGCNQKSNRDPQMQVEDFEVEGALHALRDSGWVVLVERDGGRTLRYSHQAKQQLGVDREDLAILSELLCRGPQAPGALKTRCSRMAPFTSPQEVAARLRAMAERPVPYVARLPKRPREQQPRWIHLLDGRSPEEAISQAGGAPTPTAAPDAASMPTPSTAASPAAVPTTPAVSEALEQRIEALEGQLRDLVDRLDRLEGR